MKKLILFLLLAINSYGQKNIKKLDSLITKSDFVKVIESQNKIFEQKLNSITVEYNAKNSLLKKNIDSLNSEVKSNRLSLDSIKSFTWS